MTTINRPAVTEIVRPAGLSGEAAGVWDEVVDQLAATVDVTPGDVVAVEQLVQQIVIARDARRRVETDGMIVAGAKDEPVPHPALALERLAQGEIRRWYQAIVSPAAKAARETRIKAEARAKR